MNYQELYKDMDSLTDKQLIDLVQEVSLQCFNRSVEHSISFNHRLKTTAGRVKAKRRVISGAMEATIVIEFNKLYLKEYKMLEFIAVIKHELVHYHNILRGMGYKHSDKDFIDECHRINAPLGGQAKPMFAQMRWKYHYKCMKCTLPLYRKTPVYMTKNGCSCGGMFILVENKSEEKVMHVIIYGFIL